MLYAVLHGQLGLRLPLLALTRRWHDVMCRFGVMSLHAVICAASGVVSWHDLMQRSQLHAAWCAPQHSVRCTCSMLQSTRLCAACLVCAQDSRTTQGQICSRWDEVTKQRCAYACVRDACMMLPAGASRWATAACSWYLPSAGEGEAAHPVGHARLHPSRRQPPNDASPRVSPAHAERD